MIKQLQKRLRKIDSNFYYPVPVPPDNCIYLVVKGKEFVGTSKEECLIDALASFEQKTKEPQKPNDLMTDEEVQEFLPPFWDWITEGNEDIEEDGYNGFNEPSDKGYVQQVNLERQKVLEEKNEKIKQLKDTYTSKLFELVRDRINAESSYNKAREYYKRKNNKNALLLVDEIYNLPRC